MKRFLPLLSLLLLVSLISCQSKADSKAPPSGPAEVIFLQLNDVYEISPLEGGLTGGMARVATLRQQLLAEQPATYTVLAGDFLSPSVIGTVKIDGERVKGAQMVDVMNHLGVDYVVFGNHEFDLDEPTLQKRIDESQFEWIASNVLRADSTPFFRQEGEQQIPLPQAAILETPAARIGVLGVTLDANKVDYVHYEDVYASARAVYDSLAPRTDLVIAITHLAIEQDRELAEALPGLALIMGGHEHEQHFEQVGTVPIAKADANAKTVYVHRLVKDPAGAFRFTHELVPIGPQIASEPLTDSVAQAWEALAYGAFKDMGFDLNAPVATLPEPLDGRENSLRLGPNNLGIALAHAMYDAWPGVDAGVVNSGSVRVDDVLSGAITEFDLIRTLPFGGKVLKVSLKGQLLARVLDAGLANAGNGGYLQVWQVARTDAGWEVAGQPLDPGRVYTIAISDFLLTGLESNLDFLTRDNPGITEVVSPEAGTTAADIRKVLAQYLKKL